MLRIHRNILLGMLLLIPVYYAIPAATAEEPSAILMAEVTPAQALPGAIVTIKGGRLDASHIRALYLTDGKNDYLCEMVEQKEAVLRFKVPQTIAAGRMRVAVEEAQTGAFLEEPVFVKILEPAPTGL